MKLRVELYTFLAAKHNLTPSINLHEFAKEIYAHGWTADTMKSRAAVPGKKPLSEGKNSS